MSIQTRDYTSRKTGKTTTKYYAVVFDTKQKKAIWSKQSYKTEREAKREEARMLRDLEENIRLSGKVTFQEVAKSWTDSSAENYANSTFQGYLWYLSRYLQSESKMPDISLHSAARHSFGTNLIVNENIPTSIVSSIMGNSERVLTERYVHVANSAQSIAINLYSDKIFA